MEHHAMRRHLGNEDVVEGLHHLRRNVEIMFKLESNAAPMGMRQGLKVHLDVH